jgi:hypothetical protein
MAAMLASSEARPPVPEGRAERGLKANMNHRYKIMAKANILSGQKVYSIRLDMISIEDVKVEGDTDDVR